LIFQKNPYLRQYTGQVEDLPLQLNSFDAPIFLSPLGGSIVGDWYILSITDGLDPALIDSLADQVFPHCLGPVF
jgi:hypothetical protein